MEESRSDKPVQEVYIRHGGGERCITVFAAKTQKYTLQTSSHEGGRMFTQVLDPLGNLTLTCLVALIPVVFINVNQTLLRTPAWIATALG